MKTRKARRLEAKSNNKTFVPQYKGKGVRSYDEFYGIGYERFNNKFVAVAEEKQLEEEEND